jgi:tRNA1(Val) A37 N6-methylase TrmN6
MSLDQQNDLVKHQTITRDAFLGGKLTLSQPRNGFRAGLDSVLLGASVPSGTGSVLDLGAGVGTAGLVALAFGRAERVVLAERDTETLALARANVAANTFDGRAKVVAVDVTGKGETRREAGLADNSFDVVIANPPYFAAGRGTRAPQAGRADARHMEAEALDLWLRSAAASAVAGGTAIFVYPAAGLVALLGAFDQRFGGLRVLPLAPRPASAATRVLVRGIKGSRSPLTLLGTQVLHNSQGNGFVPEIDAVLHGKNGFDW